MRRQRSHPRVWGVFDTEDSLWIGDDRGPAAYGDRQLARVGGQLVADVVQRATPGRFRAKRIFAGPYRYVDDKPNCMTLAAALAGLEEGRFL